MDYKNIKWLVDEIEKPGNNLGSLEYMVVKGLREIKTRTDRKRDEENDHIEADDILMYFLENLGFTEVVEAYNEIKKWYA